MSQLDTATKQALRLAAVGALLHNLGKINARFLDKQINGVNNDYLYQHILGLIAAHISKLPVDWQSDYEVSKLSASAVLDNATVIALKTTFNLPIPLDDRTDYTIGDLIEYLGQNEPWYKLDNGSYGIKHIFSEGSRLTHLMNRAHRGTSGGEKEDIAKAQQPNAADMYLSTPFGYETVAPNINNINDLLQEIETVIQSYLTAPNDPFPLADFIAELRPLLSEAIADTQRPLNDVTVGDIGYTGMTFLLTQVAEWILTRRAIDHDELAKKETDNALFWRVLTVHADFLRYLEEADSLADLRVRREQIQNAFQQISQKLEETLLAIEIYADEQCRLFLFPNLDQTHPTYQDVIQQAISIVDIDGLRLLAELSEPVTNHPKDKNGNGYIGDQVIKQLKTVPPYDFAPNTVKGFWTRQNEQKQTQLCTACNIRPQGYGAETLDAYKHKPRYYREKAEERRICCICMERRAGVAQEWATNNLNKTVWLDEVADSNGRLALVVGKWDLVAFIKGISYPHADRSRSKTMWLHTVKFLNSHPPDQHAFTINRQTYIWQAGQTVLSSEQELSPLKQTSLNIHAPSSMDIIVQDVAVAGQQLALIVDQDLTSAFAVDSQVKCWGQNFRVTGTHVLETVDNVGQQKILSNVVWDTTHPFIVQKTRKANVLEITSLGEGAKNESFARLRRIWQTTQTFWQDVCPTAPEQQVEESLVGQVLKDILPHRIQIIPRNRDSLDLGQYHTYDLRLSNGVKLSVVWDSDKKRLITCDNLDYLEKPELLGKLVREFLHGELTLEEPTGYGSKNKEWGKIIVQQAEPLPDSYTPIIPILAQPRTFMALVPADEALDIVTAIKTKYEREMGKVRNRLPLHLGLVYFHRRTPLRAALDAGRRMLNYELGIMKDEVWSVKLVDPNPQLPNGLADGTQQFDHTVAVTLEQNGRSLTWHVPTKMGDGQTDDNWYPYVFIKNNKEGNTHPNGPSRIFKALRPKSGGTTEECWLIHAAELQEGNEVYFTPATLDFQWLDSTARRFEIAYDDNGRRRNRSVRPYLLDDLSVMQKGWELIGGSDGLSNNQIYALRDLIETKRESWQPTAEHWKEDCQPPKGVFWQFCHDAVVTAKWKKRPKPEQIDELTNWAVSGLLTDTIQLHMGIMKQKPQRENKNND